MGIRYLNRFIHRYKVKLLDDLELCDSTVIIDGSGLFYYLYFDCLKDNGRSGGEYSELRRITNRFFDALVDRCNVRCYVVFDAFKSERNISQYLESRTMKIKETRSIERGEATQFGHGVQPIVGKSVFKQTLKELSIPYVVIPGEADSVVAAIANALDGYVLANDTDFCVYELNRGFFPMPDFRWENVVAGKCPCKVFRRQTLERTFRLPPNAISFLEPVLSSQNGLQNVDFGPVIRALYTDAPPPDNQQRQKDWRSQQSPDPLEQLLIWLGRNYRNDENVIQFLKQHVKNLPEDELKACLNEYRNLPNVSVFVCDLEGGGHRLNTAKKCLYKVGNPPVLTDFLPTVPDDHDLISCNKISFSIRHSSYQVNLMKDAGKDQVLDAYQVWVTDRKGEQYVAEMLTVTIDRSKMESLQLDFEESMLVDRADMNDIMEERQSYIFDVLLRGENKEIIESFGDKMKFVAAVLSYWSTSTEDHERHVEETIKALIFTICAIYYETPLPSKIEEIPQSSFNKRALHSSSQWLCCMKDAMFLNAILGEPLECPLIGKLFSGILYQRAFAYFRDNEDLERTAGSLFSDDVVRDAFENLLRIATDTD